MTAGSVTTAPTDPTDPNTEAGTSGHLNRRWQIAIGLLLAATVALRFLALSPLWLDEAQTVAIARRSVGSIFSTLRIDGAPPLFYLLLHFWMDAFGTGTVAVRALSGVLSVACLPLTYLAARRLGLSRRGGWIAVLVMATSPFAVRYATENRMYTLVLLLALLAVIAFERVLRAGRPVHIAAAALVTAMLLLTHYWSLFAYGVGGLIALILAIRGSVPARRCLIALVIGALPFLPWLPTFIYQSRHTGAPWGKPPGLNTPVLAPDQWSGAHTPGTLLAAVYYFLLVVAIVGSRRTRGSGLAIGESWRRLPLLLVGVAGGTLLVGAIAGDILGSAYADRYSMIALGPAVLVIAAGVLVLPDEWQIPAMALVCAFGLWACAGLPAMQRTQAQQVANHLVHAAPGDVVVFCPDQLGPAVNRLLPNTGDQVVYPTLGPADIVNWVDYKQRIRTSRPGQFTRRVLSLAGDHNIWLVYATNYPLFTAKCSNVLTDLVAARGRPTNYVRPMATLIERDGLALFPAPHSPHP